MNQTRFSPFKLCFVGLVWITLLSGLSANANPTPPLINNATLTNGLLRLDWQDGRPTYQVQTAPGIGGPWVNVGNPTTNSFALLSITNSQGLFRIAADYTAQYQVVFNASWSQATHPSNWPSNPHFSGLVGGTHNSSVHFYRQGETASEGIRLMAELGQKTTLLNEIVPAIAGGNAQLQLSGGGISPSPGSVTLTFPAPMRREFSLVTLVSMIAPSPDWFVGVDSLDLIEDGQWEASKTVTLYGLDAGTDSGASYQSADLVTTPRGVVTQFTDFPALVNGQIVPFGTYTFTRLD